MAALPEPDPDRHLIRLQKVFGVSGRIQDLAIRRRKSPTIISKDEKDREMLARSKDLRSKRLNGIGVVQRFILDLVAAHYDCETDIISDGICDEDRHCELLDSFITRDGHMAIAFFYDEFSHPGVGS